MFLPGRRCPNDQAPELRMQPGRDLCLGTGALSNSFDIIPEGRNRARKHLSRCALKNAATDHVIEESFCVVFLGKTR